MLIRRFARLWAVPFLVFLAISTTSALPNHLQEPPSSFQTPLRTARLVIQLHSERAGTLLDRQAVLKLTNLGDKSATWQTTDDSCQGIFPSVPGGLYEIEVTAIGYAAVREELQVANSLQPIEIEIVLRHDASMTDRDFSDQIMPIKARKLTKNAIAHLKSERLTQAQKQLDQAHSLAPNSADVNFLLGYLYFQQKDFGKAGKYLEAATKLNPQNAEAFTLLGRTRLERGDYSAARSALQEALLLDFENWSPHNLLADAYLREGDYQKARDEAEIAIRKGRHAASASQLILGKSLFELGQKQNAVEALNVFLQESPRHSMADQVRNVVAKISEQMEGETLKSIAAPVMLSEFDPLAAVAPPTLPRTSWQPPGIDEVKPSIALGVACPFAHVMEQSAKRVQELVENLERFSAVEDLLHQTLDNYGIPIRTVTRKYNYVASFSEPEPGILNVDEDRDEKLTKGGYPDRIATNGFATLALVFHPHMSETFAMACEGLSDWRGHATWLVYFRQRDDRPNHMHAYKVGNQMYPIGLKGRAWITADTFQIVRIESEIVHPAPDIQLLSEHQIVEYAPVPFPKKQTTMWLPRTAQIYFNLRKHHYYRRHSFDHFMLFSVDTDEKRKEPILTPSREGS
jgi:tetratricopeptide (TPR) repeat protein